MQWTISNIIRLAVYAISSLLGLLCCIRAARICNTKSHYQNLYFVRFCFPYTCFVIVLEIVSEICYAVLQVDRGNIVTDIIGVLLATVGPILLVVTFELCYLVHKRRSVNFCGLIFDRGQRVRIFPSSWIRSYILRNFVRILGVLLFVLSLCVHFDVVTPTNPESGQAGWVQWISCPLPFSEKKEWFLSLVPTAVLCLCNFYISIVMWRYGSSSSMVVHSSCFNPWFSLFFGTLALAAGSLFGESLYKITWNIGMILFFCSIILLLKEIDKEMVVADDFDEFLQSVEIIGEKSSVTELKNIDGKEKQLQEEKEKQFQMIEQQQRRSKPPSSKKVMNNNPN